MSQRLTHITITNKEIHKLLPGEAAYNNRCDGWFIGCPGCTGKGNLTGHAVIYIDKLLTVSPSVLCSCGAHYFIEHNQIRWCL
jgi:hypothetical protein